MLRKCPSSPGNDLQSARGAKGSACGAKRARLLGLVFALLIGALLSVLMGCDGFFPKPGPPPPKTAGNYLYIANGADGTIAGFTISSTGTLSAISGTPLNNGFPITTLAVSPDNAYLYAGCSNGIYEYAIGSGGALTIQNNRAPVAQDMIPTAIAIDAAGKFLLAAGIGGQSQAQSIGIYQIDPSTGLLTALQNSPLLLYLPSNSKPVFPSSLLITPNNANVYVSLGALGVQVLTFSNGILSTGSSPTLLPPNPTSSSPQDTGLASDPNSKFLFVAELNTGLRVLSIGTGGSLKEVSGSPYKVATPAGVGLDPTGSYVYVTSKGANTISGFTLNAASGQLAPIAGSPFASGGQNPVAMVNDSSKKYLAVINSGTNGIGGNNDLQLFGFSSSTPGVLVPGSAAATSSDPANPISIAATYPAAP